MTIKTFTAGLAGLVPDALLAGGGALVAFGCWSIYPPAGWIVGGGLMLAAGWLLARKSGS